MQIDRPITIALILFVILLAVFFFVLPEYNKFGALQTQLAEKTAEYNAEFVYYNDIAKTYADLQNRKDDIQKIDNALPQDPALGKLVYFLQYTAKENGLTVKDLFLSKSSTATQENSEGSGIKEIVFSTDLVGDYSSLEGFLVSLEKSSRIFEVTSISFDSTAQPPYTFNLQIKTYSY